MCVMLKLVVFLQKSINNQFLSNQPESQYPDVIILHIFVFVFIILDMIFCKNILQYTIFPRKNYYVSSFW